MPTEILTSIFGNLTNVNFCSLVRVNKQTRSVMLNNASAICNQALLRFEVDRNADEAQDYKAQEYEVQEGWLVPKHAFPANRQAWSAGEWCKDLGIWTVWYIHPHTKLLKPGPQYLHYLDLDGELIHSIVKHFPEVGIMSRLEKILRVESVARDIEERHRVRLRPQGNVVG